MAIYVCIGVSLINCCYLLLPESWDRKNMAVRPTKQERRVTVLARASSNLPYSNWEPGTGTRVMRQKIKVMGPTGPGTKNNCADEDQQ
jgi:hypothetical protein